jgi:AcrR family transcriptional regulator
VNQRQHIIATAEKLAAKKPLGSITLADVARAAKLSWPTVRRHVGSAGALKKILQKKNIASPPPETEVRARILAAAQRVFARAGYTGASVDAIARDAGLTKGAVYWHFRSKSELLLAVLGERTQHWLKVTPALVQEVGCSADPLTAFTQLMSLHLRAMQNDPAWTRLFLECMTQDRGAAVSRQLRASIGEFRRVRGELFRQLQRNGRLSAHIDADAFAVLWPALVEGLVMAWLTDPKRMDPQVLAPRIFKILWHGLEPRK